MKAMELFINCQNKSHKLSFQHYFFILSHFLLKFIKCIELRMFYCDLNRAKWKYSKGINGCSTRGFKWHKKWLICTFIYRIMEKWQKKLIVHEIGSHSLQMRFLQEKIYKHPPQNIIISNMQSMYLAVPLNDYLLVS